MNIPAELLNGAIIAVIAVFLVCTLLCIFLPVGRGRRVSPSGQDGIPAREEDVVRVQKAAGTSLEEELSSGGGALLPPPAVEITRREEPELYAEYVDPATSAARRYEIADDLYAMGYTLPFIPGMAEAYLNERKAALLAGGDARTILESTPAGGPRRDNPHPARHE